MPHKISRGTNRCIVLIFASLAVCLDALPGSAAENSDIAYNRDIRPILSENCFACHGPDSASRKADLRLDKREAAIESKAIVPGKPAESELIKRILTTDEDAVMPPPKSHKKLTAAQKSLLQRWVAAGAEYQPHWSFIAPVRPTVPNVKNGGWTRNPIDHFVLARLEAAGLTPAAEADRRTLARRLSLDLTGLPPAPAEVDRFVNDSSPQAYEQLVDRLLESKHWGEHRGRYWLDAARYADTHGIHFDNFRENWAYRDWVINAFNRNLPFDQFTIEQLAGDLLPNRTLDQQIASGFNRCNITTNEGGTIAEEYLVMYTRDRTETVAQVWLGLTANCSTCHDHKFDPLSQREFYSMAAFFNNTTQNAMDGNIKDTPPVIVVPSAEDQATFARIAAELADVRKQAETRRKAARGDFDKWLAAAKADDFAAAIPREKLLLNAPFSEGQGDRFDVLVGGESRPVTSSTPLVWDKGFIADKGLRIQPDVKAEWPEVGDFDRDQPFSCSVWIKPTKRGLTGSIIGRMEEAPGHRGWDFWLENGRVGMHVVHRWQDDALKVVATSNELKPNDWHHVLVTYDGSGKAAGVKVFYNGEPQPTKTVVDGLKNSPRTETPLKLAQRSKSSRLENIVLQDLRVYGKQLDASEIQRLARSSRAASLATKPADKRTDAEKNELFDWWLAANDPAHQQLQARITALQSEEAAVRSRGTIAHVMQEKNAEAMAFVLFRGEYDKRRDPVKPNTPAFLPTMPDDLPRSRLGFAHWLLRAEHPLTARVTVNRFWQEVFGSGLVRTTGDLGGAGELPSHPELLDWLAVDFRENGWDVKRLFKLFVTSATYRQAATTTPVKLEKDLQNRWLSRGPRFRMDAEMVRDYALAASGLLVPKLGGPSVKPYQPEGVWEAVAMIGSNTRDYRRDTGDALYRRGMYTFWKRSAPPASLEIFNAPNREYCTVRRERTNTPLQALVTLNDPQFVEAARHLAQTALLQQAAKPTDRIDFLAQRILARPFRPEELAVVQKSLDELAAFYDSHPDDAKALIAVGESKADASLAAPTLAAWTMLVNELLNLDEALNK